jgi:hypothetical protein
MDLHKFFMIVIYKRRVSNVKSAPSPYWLHLDQALLNHGRCIIKKI